MFRDSRGVVHTVSSADPLEDLPPEAGDALARALLVPCEGDLGGALERCEAVRQLLDSWQDAFFASLPADIDLEEEARWAEQAGLSLSEVEGDWEEDGDDWDDDEDDGQTPGQIELVLDDEPLFDLEPPGQDVLGEEIVSELERALLLLPLRTRLEALVAAGVLVDDWADLFADHEKCLGHLVLKHGASPDVHLHEVLVDEHARLHAGLPGHGA